MMTLSDLTVRQAKAAEKTYSIPDTDGLGLVVVVMAGFLAIKFWTPATPAQPVQATPPPAAAQAAKPTAPPAAAKTAKKPPPKPSKPRTVEQCLKIADEHVMVRCLERAP